MNSGNNHVFGPFLKTEANMRLRSGQLSGASNAVHAVLLAPTPPGPPLAAPKKARPKPTTSPLATARD